MSAPQIVLVAAVSRNGVIGRDGDMPWRLSTDLKRFKALTLGKPVIVGRRTFESFGGRPLPGRPHVLVSRNAGLAIPDVDIAPTFEQALEIAARRAQETGADEINVIGGGDIYAQAMAFADLLRITHVEADITDGDTFFPAIDPQFFTLERQERFPAGEKDSFPTRFAVYRRHRLTDIPPHNPPTAAPPLNKA